MYVFTTERTRMANGQLFIISAPTGAGKTTLANAVIKKLAPNIVLHKVITYTTRPPRQREINGVDYYFVSPEQFTEKKAAGYFLETNFYNNNWYGSPNSIKTDIEAGKALILITDRNGARDIKELIPEAYLIWISVPDIKQIEARLNKRGSERDQALMDRIEIAQEEMELEEKENLFEAHIMNEDLETALNTLADFIRLSVPPFQ